MATTPSDIPNLSQSISDAQKQASTYQNALNQSPTALAGEGAPTSSDISNQESLQRIQSSIQNLTDQKLKTQWYGSDTNANTEGVVAPPQPGVIGTALDYLQRPLLGVVGAVKHFTGQGQGSLYQDVADNMVRNKSTFGDVLKSTGVPWAVSAPLGFTLDVAMDPVNWLTMGEGAMIPRLVGGAAAGFTSGEGIAEGISAAAKSGLMEKATAVGRLIPGLKDSEAFAKFGESTLQAVDQFQGITGKTAENIVVKGANYRNGWNNIINKVANIIPGGQTILDSVKYDPAAWVRDARIKDILQSSLGTGVDTSAAVAASLKGESIEPFLKQGAESVASQIESAPGKIGQIPGGGPFDINMDPNSSLVTNKEVDQLMTKLKGTGLDEKMVAAAPKIVNGVDDSMSILKDPLPYMSSDPIENARRIASEKLGGPDITLEDLARVSKSGALNETGVKWYDNMINGIKDFGSKTDDAGNKIPGIGKAIMDKYDQALGVFRAFKVGSSPTAWMNAIVGESIMTHMGIGDLTPEFLGRLKQSADMYANKTDAAAFIDGLLMNAGKALYGDENVIRAGLAESPTAAKGIFGDTRFLGSTDNAKLLIQHAVDLGIAGADTKPEDLAPALQQALSDLEKVRMDAGTEPVRAMLLKGGDVNKLDLGTEMLNNDMFNSSATRKMLDYVSTQAKADPGNLAWKFLDATLNNMPSGYTKAHQAFKMATFLRATVDGYDINQLRLASRLIDINPEDITKIAKGGQYRYALSPRAAVDLSNALYINYSAMPSAIKVLRNMPLLGSPFISFSYAMAMKTGQTLAYNPAAFNKISFALNDFGGSKTPLEKKALGTSFYSYLQQPGMFRMPFFDQAPIYTNLSKMIPYYSLNMFDPSQTQYSGNTWGETLSQAVQGSPILKDPVGATLFNYLIQPMILNEAIRPQGQFGEPLYPVDANLLQKTGYAARSLGESFVPNAASYAGLLTPQSVADYVPSYRWRQLSYAKAGKNQLGISGKEAPASRTIRTLLQTTGIPVEAPVNTTFSANQSNSNAPGQ